MKVQPKTHPTPRRIARGFAPIAPTAPAALTALMAAAFFFAAPPARPDCGSIPFEKPFINSDFIVKSIAPQINNGPKTVEFDPLKVTVFEPGQRAILLWNGAEEILLLSTDQRASQNASILEVIPLPAEPKVRLGSFDTFEAAQRLVVEKRLWACAHGGAQAGAAALPADAGRITFQQRLGAHDLAVAEVLNREKFTAFVQNYLREQYNVAKAPIRPEFVSIIQSYLDQGFRWFAFDVIDLSASVQSRQPIEYRFKSDAVYYPLRISSLESGVTKVDHLVITAQGARRFLGLPEKQLDRKPALQLTLDEAEKLDPQWKGFFPKTQSTLVLDQWTLQGESAKLTTDLRVR